MAEKEGELREAARSGNVERVNQLLEEGVAQTPDEEGDTPLLLATSCYVTQPKYVEVVRSLLDNGADVNHKNISGNAAIHNSASNGHLEICELLLDNGADYETEGEIRSVPLGLAALKKHHAVVNCLLKKLIEENKFSSKQVEWMNNAENDSQQIQIYRALTGIFNEKTALVALTRMGVIQSIVKGIKKFQKISTKTSGLQLLNTILSSPEGLEKAKSEASLKNDLNEACKDISTDPVVSHLLNEVVSKL